MAQSALTLAARTLRRNIGRSVVMGLGLVIGVASISLTVATGEGARRAIEKGFKTMVGALDVLFIQPGGAAQRGMASLETSITTLTLDDANAIGANVPNVRTVAAEQNDMKAAVEGNGKNGVTALFGATPNWAAVRGDSVVEGAFFSDDLNREMARVAVVGADVRRDYLASGPAVGQHIRVRGIEFEVIGVLGPHGAGPGGASMDNLIYVPIETSRRRVFNKDAVMIISAKLDDPTRWAETQAAATALLRERHGKHGSDLDDFHVNSPQSLMNTVATVDSTLRRAFLWVGVLALVIGGVVIANLMFAATVSRGREIATRRAVGASRADVLRQFWAESVLVSTVAGVAGALLALALIEGGAGFMRMPLAISWPVIVGAVLATIVIGAIAGYVPARRAAMVPPAIALRDAG